jgi:Protein of unknown function (DUF2490)
VILHAVACAGAVFMLIAENAGADEVLGALELGVRHELAKAVDLSGGLQLRFDEGFSRIERWMPEATIGYELVKPLTIGTGYRLIYARNASGDFEIAHRVHLQGALSFKLKPLGARLKYRLRLQDRFERHVGEPTDHQPTLRNALELSHTAWAFLNPFISGEHYLSLDELEDNPTRRWKLVLGVQQEVAAAELELYYRLDVPVGNDDPDRHMIGLGMRLDI